VLLNQENSLRCARLAGHDVVQQGGHLLLLPQQRALLLHQHRHHVQ